jgi:hypothetical protein
MPSGAMPRSLAYLVASPPQRKILDKFRMAFRPIERLAGQDEVMNAVPDLVFAITQWRTGDASEEQVVSVLNGMAARVEPGFRTLTREPGDQREGFARSSAPAQSGHRACEGPERATSRIPPACSDADPPALYATGVHLVQGLDAALSRACARFGARLESHHVESETLAWHCVGCVRDWICGSRIVDGPAKPRRRRYRRFMDRVRRRNRDG